MGKYVGAKVGVRVVGDDVGGNGSGISSRIPTSKTIPTARIPNVVVNQQHAFRDPIVCNSLWLCKATSSRANCGTK